MKILVISAAYPPLRSGGADFVAALAERLQSAGHEVRVLTSEPGPTSRNGTTYATVPSWRWSAIKPILQEIDDFKPEAVDIHFTGWVYKDHPMVTFLPTLIKHRYPQIRVVTHIESLGGVRRERSSIVAASVRKLVSLWAGTDDIGYEYGTLLRDSDSVIVLGERDRDELGNFYPADRLAEKVSVIAPPPIMPIAAPLTAEEKRELGKKLPKREGATLIGFYGYVYPGKGLETLLLAMQQLNQDGLAAELAVIGGTAEPYVYKRAGKPGYIETLKAEASRLGLSEHIHWLGYAPAGSSEPSKYLQLCDLCVFPFDSGVHMNNSSLSFALAHALPVVATKSDNSESVFQDGTNLIFCRPRDHRALAAAIARVANDETLQKSLAQGALELANERFSWQRAIRATELALSGPAPDNEFKLRRD